jgi:hypothetical protein
MKKGHFKAQIFMLVNFEVFQNDDAFIFFLLILGSKINMPLGYDKLSNSVDFKTQKKKM